MSQLASIIHGPGHGQLHNHSYMVICVKSSMVEDEQETVMKQYLEIWKKLVWARLFATDSNKSSMHQLLQHYFVFHIMPPHCKIVMGDVHCIWP